MFPFPLHCPKSGSTQLIQGMLVDLPFGLLTLEPSPLLQLACPARDVVQRGGGKLGCDTRQT